MGCKMVRAWFSDYSDGQPVAVWPRILVWLHLHICPGCRRVNRSMQAMNHALAALRDEPPRMDE